LHKRLSECELFEIYSEVMGSRWRETLGLVVPSWFTRLTYWSLYLWTKSLVALFSPGSQVWVRNSLVFGKARFAQSDIDLSILVREDAEVIRLKALSRAFPLVHEINWYRHSSVLESCQWINPIELKCDPTLEKIVRAGPINHRDLLAEHKLTFLLRKMESCRTQFTGEVRWQKTKWQHYLRLAGQSEDLECPDDFFRLIEDLSKECGIIDSIVPVLKNYLKAEQEGIPRHVFIDQSPADASMLLSLLPHRFCFIERPVVPAFPKVMLAQLRWESWALDTQRVGRLTPEQIAHAARLQRWMGQPLDTLEKV